MEKRREDMLKSSKEILKKTPPNGTKVILFGSQARGDAHKDSGWYLLDKDKIIPQNFDRFIYPLVEFGWILGEYFSMKLFTFQKWMKRKRTPFYQNVAIEGIEL